MASGSGAGNENIKALKHVTCFFQNEICSSKIMLKPVHKHIYLISDVGLRLIYNQNAHTSDACDLPDV